MSLKTVISQVEEIDEAQGDVVFVPQNKVLYVDTFNNDAPSNSEEYELYSPHNIDEVFAHYQPSVKDVEMSSLDDVVLEDFAFHSISDFDEEELISQSSTMSELRSTINTCNNITHLIEHNRALRQLLAKEEDKQTLLHIFSAMKRELDEHIK